MNVISSPVKKGINEEFQEEIEVVRLRGFEPLTHCFEGSCSIQLSYRRKKKQHKRGQIYFLP